MWDGIADQALRKVVVESGRTEITTGMIEAAEQAKRDEFDAWHRDRQLPNPRQMTAHEMQQMMMAQSEGMRQVSQYYNNYSAMGAPVYGGLLGSLGVWGSQIRCPYCGK